MMPITVSNRHLQRITASVCSLSLVALLLSSPISALAAGSAAGTGGSSSSSGTLTIEQYDYNAESNDASGKDVSATTYIGFQVFEGDVIDYVDDDGNTDTTTQGNYVKTIEDVQFAATDSHTAAQMASTVLSVIEGFCDEEGADFDYYDIYSTDASTCAQRAAEFIAEHIGDEDGTASGTFPGLSDTIYAYSGAFAMELALALSETEATASVNPSEQTDLECGWWLLAADSSTLSEGMSGTSPVFATIGGSDVVLDEKIANSTYPVKSVIEDSTGQWGSAADADVGQALSYRIVATIADNWKSYATYKLVFSDTFTGGKIVTEEEGGSDPTLVWEDGDGQETDVTGYFDIEISSTLSAEDTLTAGCPDILEFYDGGTITLYYTACLTDEAVCGASGNANSPTLVYSNDPLVPESTGTSQGDEVKAYTYQIVLEKDDDRGNLGLAGACFTLQVAAGNSDEASAGLYVQADGSLAEEPYEFETDSKGKAVFPGIDEGTYTLSETKAPPALSEDYEYETIDDVTIVVESNIGTLASDESGASTLELSASSSKKGKARIVSVNADEGCIYLTVIDPSVQLDSFFIDLVGSDRTTGLAKTGASTLLVLLAITALAAGSLAMRRRRKNPSLQAEESVGA